VIDEIRKRLHRVPFVPFAVRTSDGHEYSVLGPIHINSVIEQANGE
jgi:hypothetical protein